MKPHYTNTNNPVDFPKMNERIEELKLEAADWARRNHQAVDPQNLTRQEYEQRVLMMLDKFAELLVQACAKTIEAQDVDPSFKLRMSWAIKTQFGVKQ